MSQHSSRNAGSIPLATRTMRFFRFPSVGTLSKEKLTPIPQVRWKLPSLYQPSTATQLPSKQRPILTRLHQTVDTTSTLRHRTWHDLPLLGAVDVEPDDDAIVRERDLLVQQQVLDFLEPDGDEPESRSEALVPNAVQALRGIADAKGEQLRGLIDACVSDHQGNWVVQLLMSGASAHTARQASQILVDCSRPQQPPVPKRKVTVQDKGSPAPRAPVRGYQPPQPPNEIDFVEEFKNKVAQGLKSSSALRIIVTQPQKTPAGSGPPTSSPNTQLHKQLEANIRTQREKIKGLRDELDVVGKRWEYAMKKMSSIKVDAFSEVVGMTDGEKNVLIAEQVEDLLGPVPVSDDDGNMPYVPLASDQEFQNALDSAAHRFRTSWNKVVENVRAQNQAELDAIKTQLLDASIARDARKKLWEAREQVTIEIEKCKDAQVGQDQDIKQLKTRIEPILKKHNILQQDLIAQNKVSTTLDAQIQSLESDVVQVQQAAKNFSTVTKVGLAKNWVRSVLGAGRAAMQYVAGTSLSQLKQTLADEQQVLKKLEQQEESWKGVVDERKYNAQLEKLEAAKKEHLQEFDAISEKDDAERELREARRLRDQKDSDVQLLKREKEDMEYNLAELQAQLESKDAKRSQAERARQKQAELHKRRLRDVLRQRQQAFLDLRGQILSTLKTPQPIDSLHVYEDLTETLISIHRHYEKSAQPSYTPTAFRKRSPITKIKQHSESSSDDSDTEPDDSESESEHSQPESEHSPAEPQHSQSSSDEDNLDSDGAPREQRLDDEIEALQKEVKTLLRTKERQQQQSEIAGKPAKVSFRTEELNGFQQLAETILEEAYIRSYKHNGREKFDKTRRAIYSIRKVVGTGCGELMLSKTLEILSEVLGKHDSTFAKMISNNTDGEVYADFRYAHYYKEDKSGKYPHLKGHQDAVEHPVAPDENILVPGVTSRPISLIGVDNVYGGSQRKNDALAEEMESWDKDPSWFKVWKDPFTGHYRFDKTWEDFKEESPDEYEEFMTKRKQALEELADIWKPTDNYIELRMLRNPKPKSKLGDHFAR